MATVTNTQSIGNSMTSYNGKRSNSQSSTLSLLNKAVVGMTLFLSTEVMFFGGLISTFLILRAASDAWPPPGQPLLPVAVTGFNTILLIVSGFTMNRAWKKIKNNDSRALIKWLAGTTILGIIFLVIQGYEWISLVKYGLTFASSVYGGTFYALIGCHGLHVLGAVLFLLVVFKKSLSKKYSSQNYAGVTICCMYWYFVVGIWPILYLLVYLN